MVIYITEDLIKPAVQINTSKKQENFR